MEYILVTGGLGFIGSHTCVELLNDNYNIIVIDNLSNSSKIVKNQIKKITKKEIILYTFDLMDIDKLCHIFKKHNIKAVLHFAGLKAVNDSIKKPLLYYKTNITITLNLLSVMEIYQCNNIIFSSSATVYGNSGLPLTETSKIGEGIINPYGQTKFIIETILKDIYQSKNSVSNNIIILRYFNPIGAHSTGLIGENPNDIPTNLMPYILKVGQQNNDGKYIDERYDFLNIFGGNYETSDGTCVRDYIHVVDVAQAHVKSLKKMLKNKSYFRIYNLGTGVGHSVLELIETFENVNNVKIPYKIVERRKGDRIELYCNNSLAIKELDWKPLLTLEDMCKDSWKFQKN